MVARLSEDKKPHRPIRSFVRRSGRLTEGQARALETLWPRFGIEAGGSVLDFQQLFQRQAPTFLEIGFGMGQSLAEMAKQRPQHNFIGIEVHQPGVGSLLCQVKELGLENIRVISADAVDVMNSMIAAESLDGVYLFFPDPWHKKRHHKRRIVQTAFVETMAKCIKPGGALHMATDWKNYAEHMLDVAEACDLLENTAGPGNYSPDKGSRVETKFERRGLRLGHGIWDLIYLRKKT